MHFGPDGEPFLIHFGGLRRDKGGRGGAAQPCPSLGYRGRGQMQHPGNTRQGGEEALWNGGLGTSRTPAHRNPASSAVPPCRKCPHPRIRIRRLSREKEGRQCERGWSWAGPMTDERGGGQPYSRRVSPTLLTTQTGDAEGFAAAPLGPWWGQYWARLCSQSEKPTNPPPRMQEPLS